MSFKQDTLAIVFTLCISLVQTVSAEVVYQDLFDNDTVATNTSTGGGISTDTNVGAAKSFMDNGDLSIEAATSGNQVSTAWSQNAFSIADGFTLDVGFNVTALGLSGNPPFPSNSFSFGLLDVATTGSDVSSSFVSDTPDGKYGIGMSLTTRLGNQGLSFLDGTNRIALSNDQTVAAGVDQTFSLTVDSTGAFSYSLNGAAATNGTTTLDLTRDYHFTVLSQGSDGGSLISSVTLNRAAAIPEPTSIASLAALFTVVGVSRRKRRRT